MTVSAAILRRIAGMESPDAMREMLLILADQEATEEERKAKQAERKRRSRDAKRDSHGTVTGQERDGHGTLPQDKEKVPDLQKKTQPQFSPPSEVRTNRAREAGDDFEAFWEVWPHKVGKPAALRAFPRALRAAGSLQTIIDGVREYIRTKPPDRQWLNPATFLNQERWADEPAQAATGPAASQGNAWAALATGRYLDEPDTEQQSLPAIQ